MKKELTKEEMIFRAREFGRGFVYDGNGNSELLESADELVEKIEDGWKTRPWNKNSGTPIPTEDDPKIIENKEKIEKINREINEIKDDVPEETQEVSIVDMPYKDLKVWAKDKGFNFPGNISHKDLIKLIKGD